MPDRRNFRPLSAAEYTERVLEHPAFDAQGLLLAWRRRGDSTILVGIAHAFRPAPQDGAAATWGEGHALALLYVQPDARHQGVGSRLIQAVENWLYYCPVLVGWPGTPAYGTVETLRAPFFGSSEHMGVSALDGSLTRFLSGRGYRISGAGDVSMVLDLAADPSRWAASPTQPPAVQRNGLQLLRLDEKHPFMGGEPEGRPRLAQIGDNGGAPYTGLALVDDAQRLLAHALWHPLAPTRAAFTNFRVAPGLRNQGLGSYLLDEALHGIATQRSAQGAYQSVELLTHLMRNAAAVRLYEARGFVPAEVWVQMEKT